MTMPHFSYLRTLVGITSLVALMCPTVSLALGLLAAYEAALTNDPAYRAAIVEKEAAQEYKVLGRANLLPTVSASYYKNKNHASIDTASPNGNTVDDRKYTSSATSLQFRQPLIHTEGKARFNQGIAQTLAADAQFMVRSQELIVRLVSLYANAKYAEDQLDQAIAQREAYAEQRRANERMLQRGEGTRTDVLETQAKYDLAEAQVLEARDGLVNTRLALSAVVGQEIERLDALADDFKAKTMSPANFEAWRDLALANNPEITAQRFAVEIALEEINKNRAGHYPRLDLIASASKNSSDTTSTINQSTNSRSIGVQLNVPLYSGGSVSAATRQAIANHQKAQAELEAKTGQIVVELRKQFNLTLSGVARIAAAEKSLSSSSLLVEATQKSVTGGVRTNADVLDAKQKRFEAKRDLALARYNYLLAHLRLRYSAGTLSSSDLQDVSAYFVSAP
jgi:outer membrane protein, protease secretion system